MLFRIFCSFHAGDLLSGPLLTIKSRTKNTSPLSSGFQLNAECKEPKVRPQYWPSTGWRSGGLDAKGEKQQQRQGEQTLVLANFLMPVF